MYELPGVLRWYVRRPKEQTRGIVYIPGKSIVVYLRGKPSEYAGDLLVGVAVKYRRQQQRPHV